MGAEPAEAPVLRSVREGSFRGLALDGDGDVADLHQVHDLTMTIIELRRDAGDLAALAHAARRFVEGDPSDVSALAALRQAVENLPNRRHPAERSPEP